MPIVARSAPNNGRVKEAKVSSCTRDIDKATIGNKNNDVKGKVRKGRGENNWKL